MKKILLTLILILASGVSGFSAEYPTVNVPYALRQENWGGYEGGGSCVHVSMVTLLRWQGQYALADWWYNTYNSGEYASRMAQRMTAAGIPFAETRNGEVAFLDWALKTRRGANVVVLGGAHMVTLTHFDAKYACILDNNYTAKYTWYTRDDFIKYWRASGGWAYTPLYSPAPPIPKR